ncbi:MAG: hypothetical protein M1821_001573 [Bathelium mastoideum]|nr:MAG: hypothetical protein M1821_001573 [Bathelium mastoideum]KAI9691459.1 MAG: hypothetical protein M1822_007530 [Bathelium mastoideum]
MSLLQSEEFALYQLRTAYLTHIKDGVGERLINVNTTVLNDPAFRDAGWVPNTAEIKRTYSPPIPTAITSEYFQAPPRSAGLTGGSFDDEDDAGGMVTGHGGSQDTVGPSLNARKKRRKEQHEEDDSSDLSDDSDEDGDGQPRPSQTIKFQKMPLRSRAGSSPIRDSRRPDEPSVMITSPSHKPDAPGLRRGSLGAVEQMRRRRADTVTSSEMSSENELDPSLFKRKPVMSSHATKASRLLAEQIDEDERESVDSKLEPPVEEDAGDSDLSSDLEGSLDSNSLLEEAGDGLTSSPLPEPPDIPPAITPQQSSPRKTKQATAGLQALPPPRPISMIQPSSALTMAIKAKNKKPVNPIDRFAVLSGKGDPNPLYIKIYAPFSSDPEEPIEVLLRRSSTEGTATTVAEVIGLSLWRYVEEGLKPLIEGEKLNVNRWVLRMVDDGEVEYDFEPPSRTKPIVDFTSNNNRGARPRARDKPWDEFAIVEAKLSELKENERLTPVFSEEAAASVATAEDGSGTPTSQPEAQRKKSEPPTPPTTSFGKSPNPITGPTFAPSALRKDSTNLLDAPAPAASNATPRTGAAKIITVHFLDNNLNAHSTKLNATTDTYIAEIFDQVCKKLNVDKALYILRVSRTNIVAPSDRTVEALGNRASLDLSKKRFIGEADFGLSGSPGSSSPNAPLLLTSGGMPTKGGRRKVNSAIHPLAQKSAEVAGMTNPAAAVQNNYKRYNVVRKQPMSFTPSHPRVLLLDGEFMHIMPGETGGAGAGAAAPTGKFTTVSFSNIVGCKVSRKHPKTVRVSVYRERETKRYDFEANSPSEAQEIVGEIKKGIAPYYNYAEDMKP